jgi:hypothetical protein
MSRRNLDRHELDRRDARHLLALLAFAALAVALDAFGLFD